MKYKLFMIMLVIFSIGLVVAEGEELYYELNQTLDLKVYCFNVNDTLCSTSSTCQITVFYPNSTIYINNESMDFNNNYWNHTQNQTDTLGVYSSMVTCQDGADEGYASFDFYVGKPSTRVQIYVTITGIFVLLVVAGILFTGFYFSNRAPYRWSFFLIGLFFLVMAVNVTAISMFDEVASSGVKYIFDQLGAICYYLYWFIGGLFLMVWILTFLASMADRKHMAQAKAIGRPVNINSL